MRSFFVGAAVSCAIASSAAAQAHPNFTGTWTLDPKRSEGSTTLPDSVTWILVQHGDTVTADRAVYTADNGKMTSHVVVGADGKPWKNTILQPGAGEVVTSSTVTWEGAVLVTTTAGNIQGTDFIQTDRWTMAADGKSLSSRRAITVDGTEVQSATYFMVKKP